MTPPVGKSAIATALDVVWKADGIAVHGRDCFALHAKYGLPPHRMTSKAINDVKKFSGADRAKWLEIKRNDSNASTKCKGAVVGFTAMKKKRKRGGD